MVKNYNFGIEIEAVTKPYGGGERFTNSDWYRQLAQKLRNRGISAVHDDCSKYSKHPEYYGGKWFVTRDGSLKRPRPYVCMEVVSPKLDTTQPVSHIISDFWEAMHVHFKPVRDSSCGGHVHVTPVSLKDKFSFKDLKKIAFATAVQSVGAGIRETFLLYGQDRKLALRNVAAEIKSKTTKADLYYYMQGNRYVLWNFQNIFTNPKTGRCTGTVEFRGGNQFLNTKGTLAWVAFVLGFITLALDDDLSSTLESYTSSTDPKFEKRLREWWRRIRRAARKPQMSRHLPKSYLDMHTR
ncbi:hypothetical protein PT974_09359 [Cladobotryum mycophilum]|uniref:Swim zinc finger domain protein n=1 Tax=Cladobotryum mycophilum TaxID=491253 RepID=A0ABR0SGX9_9HYPO